MRVSTTKLDSFTRELLNRKERLGISQQILAKLTGVSAPTIQRLFSGSKNISLDNLSKIASGLGLSLSLNSNKKEEEIIIERAHQKAKQLAKLVQGTSALESQGLDKDTLQKIEEQIFSDLFKGSRSRLWSD